MPNTTPAPPAREALTDSRTNFVSRPWYMFFQSLYQNFLNYIGAQPPADGEVLRYDAAGQGWINSVGFTVDPIGRAIATDTLSVNSITETGSGGTFLLVNGDEAGAFLLLTHEAISELAEISFIGFTLNATAPKINITSYSDISIAAGGVDCFLLSPTNGFLSLSTGSIPTPTAQLDISNNTIRLRNSRTPASATASGNRGDICWDTNYIYVCVATNTWKRTAISGW